MPLLAKRALVDRQVFPKRLHVLKPVVGRILLGCVADFVATLVLAQPALTCQGSPSPPPSTGLA